MMKFFVLKYTVGSENETAYDSSDDRVLGDAPKCVSCGAWIGLRPWLPPYRATLQVYGRFLGDIAFESGNDLLLSERLLTAWDSRKLGGLSKLSPVEVLGVKPKRFSKQTQPYFHFAVPRSETYIDFKKSKIRYSTPISCKVCYAADVDAVKRLVIDESTWTGEHIFEPRGLPAKIVTERVVRLAEEFDLKNVTTVPVEEYVWNPL